MSRKGLSVIMASAAFGGTIAACRNLAANGISVSVLSSSFPFDAAAWSKSVSRSYQAPKENCNEKFLKRLINIGKNDPGQLLLPTSDETAWMYSENADLLSPYFCLYQPPITTTRRILDKKLLAIAATSAGLATLPCWYPSEDEDIESLAADLPYPMLIKPRTHVHRKRNNKGVLALNKNELINAFAQFMTHEPIHRNSNPLLPDAHIPMLQKFVDVRIEGVYSVSGFIDRSRKFFLTRHAIKLLQRSQPVGVGVCFESQPADPELSEAARRLCLELGYFGVFEIEFIWYGGRWNVIDFNPRMYSQIGMDIRRNAPLPYLAYLDAADDAESIQIEIAKAQQAGTEEKAVFYDRFTLRALILAQTITQRISREDRDHWRQWVKQNAQHSVDFSADTNDRMPGIVHALSEIYLGLKAFPRFLRSTSYIPKRNAL